MTRVCATVKTAGREEAVSLGKGEVRRIRP